MELAKRIVDLTGFGHAKVQVELNRLVGIMSVGSATNSELERRLRHGRFGCADASLGDMPAVEHHPAFEEYCECIFELDEDDVAVIQARIAERLQVSRPAVSEMIRRLETEGLITTDRAIRLTTAGQALAQRRAPPSVG